MRATTKLRFIERQVEINGDHKLVRILQQWWEDEDRLFNVLTKTIKGEWRDVPLEAE